MLLRAHSTRTAALGTPGTRSPGHHRAGSPARARKEPEFLLHEQQTPRAAARSRLSPSVPRFPLSRSAPPGRLSSRPALAAVAVPGVPAGPALLPHRCRPRPAPPRPSCPAAPRLLPARTISFSTPSVLRHAGPPGKNRKRTEVMPDSSDTQQGLPGCLGFRGTEQRPADPRRSTAGTGSGSLAGDLLPGHSPASLAALRALSMLVPGGQAGRREPLARLDCPYPAPGAGMAERWRGRGGE